MPQRRAARASKGAAPKEEAKEEVKANTRATRASTRSSTRSSKRKAPEAKEEEEEWVPEEDEAKAGANKGTKTSKRVAKAKTTKGKKKQKKVVEDIPGSAAPPAQATDGAVDEVGLRVTVKGKDGKWHKGTVIQLQRFGVTQLYKVRAVKVLLDRNKMQEIPITSEDIKSLGQKKEIRYWTSGTPCMRTGPSVDDHARDTKKKAEDRIKQRLAQTQRPKSRAKFSGPAAPGLARAEAKAKKIMADLAKAKGEGKGKAAKGKGKGKAATAPTNAQVLDTLKEMGGEWPTQIRPNVTPDGKAVPGMCLGLVNVLGGKGMQVSQASHSHPNLCQMLTAWCVATIPHSDFPFSSLQVNYNYKARKHVDGNNIGPSYICSIGGHTGGGLWTGDQFVTSGDPNDNMEIKCGGGPTILECRNKWILFNGNAEHETQDFGPTKKGEMTRISFIAFSHHAYNKIPPYVTDELAELGFTAGSSDLKELPFYNRFRLDKHEFNEDENTRYFKYQLKRATEQPPPIGECKMALECFGLTMARGGGWMSYCEKHDDKKPTIIELKPNMTGFHALELKVIPGDKQRLELVSQHTDRDRFNIYKDTDKETGRFSRWVDKMPAGHVVMICITDTAVAAKRPPGQALYNALAKLGGSPTMERILYRCPFAMIGVKGAKENEALVVMEKTKVLVRLEASASGAKGKVITLKDQTSELTDVNEAINRSKPSYNGAV